MTNFGPDSGGYLPPPPPPPAKRSARPVVLAAIVSLIVGVIIGYTAGHSGQKKASATGTNPAITSAAPVAAASADPVPSFAPSSEPVPEDTEPPTLRPADFRIKLKIKRKECFGSAGCNLTYRIVPTYVGTEDVSSGSWDVTYVVRGGEDGPQTNTFTLEDGQASFDSEEVISTSSSSTRLTVKVTSVDANG